MPKTDNKKVTSASKKEEEKKKKKQVVESSDSSSDSESSSDSSSDSSSSEEVVKKNGKTNGKATKKVESSSSSSDSESSSDSSSSDAKKDKKRKTATPAKKDDSSSSSSSDESSDSESDSSSSSSEEVAAKPAAKKQKLSEESFNVTAKEPARQAAPAAAGGGSRLYIRNLPWTIQDSDVHTFFAECGTVTGIKWIENKETGRFTGSGIIDFETAEAAAAAVAKNGTDLGGRPVGIEYSRASNNAGGAGGFNNNRAGGFGDRGDRGNNKRQEASSSFDKKNARAPTPKPDGCRTIFVGNLNFSVDDPKITEFFADCGEVREIRWIEKDGQFKGCGFIEFQDSNATDGAVAKNGASFLGRPIRIDFAAGKGQ